MTAIKPKQILGSKSFREFLDSIDERPIIAKWLEWAHEDTSDKRVSMEAGKELMKLKDRYPAGKLKIQAYNEELARLGEDS